MTGEQHPNERLVTPSEDGEGFDRSLVSRRSMLGGSALLAGLLAYTSDPTDPQLPGRASGSAAGIARASDNPDEPLIILGPESDPVGYLFQDAAGGIILQDATSGNHFWYNQAQGRWETDAELDVPTLTATTTTTEDLAIGSADFVASGDFVGLGPSTGPQQRSVSTTSTSYVSNLDFVNMRTTWNLWRPANAQGSVYVEGYLGASAGDVRLQNTEDGETAGEQLDIGSDSNFTIGPTNYEPTTLGSQIELQLQLRTNDGGTSSTLFTPQTQLGVQV